MLVGNLLDGDAQASPFTQENPCREVSLLKEENQRNRYLTPEEERRLLEVCTGDRAHLKPILLLALHTGMRRGETLSLRWDQIDLTRGFIHLVRTKSGKSRDVPINQVVRDELLTLKVGSRSEFVFASETTGRAIVDCKRAWTSACRLAQVADLHFHDLRHTAATRMAETGAEPSTIKDMLGHSDLRMTDRYTHAVESRKRAALDRLAEYGKSAEVVSLEERREERRQA